MTREVIIEGLQMGELSRLVQPLFGLDEYKSKIGRDKDICVVNFITFGIGPANDIADFIEKSYDWVLDADVSHGEVSDGNYMVYVEFPRSDKSVEYIVQLISDMNNLTMLTDDDWSFMFFRSDRPIKYTKDALSRLVIRDPKQYDVMLSAKLNNLRAVSGVGTKPSKVDDPVVKTLQRNAGLI